MESMRPFAWFSKPLSLDEVMERHRLRLRKGEAATLKRLEKAWKIAQAAIEGDLAEILGEIATAEAQGLSLGYGWVDQKESYQGLLRTIDREVERWGGAVAEETREGQGRAVKEAASDGHAQEKAALREAEVVGNLQRLNPAVMEHLVGFLGDGSPIADLFEGIGKGMSERARTIFAEEMGRGTGSRAIGRRLTTELETTRRRGETIARTETNRCYRSARLESLRQRPDLWEGWMWQSALDKRTCPICWGLHGTVYTLDQDWPGSHPNCRCTMRPLAKGRLRKAEPTGDEVLRAMPEKERASLSFFKTSPRRYEEWKKGTPLSGMILDTRHERWGKGKKLVPLYELENRRLTSTIS